jgi:hypothetical protein
MIRSAQKLGHFFDAMNSVSDGRLSHGIRPFEP